MSSKRWVVVVNNYTERQYQTLLDLFRTQGKRWNIGKEIGPKCGTPHLQCAVEWNVVHNRKWMAANVGLCWYQCMIAEEGDDEGAFNYCGKDKDFVSHGCEAAARRVKKPGQRKDIARAYAAARRGDTLRTFMDTEEPGAQAIQVFSQARLVLTVPPEWRDVNVISYVGNSGTGKSRRAMAYRCADGRRPWVSSRRPDGAICWDTYDRQDTIILDDYRPDMTKFHDLIRFIDGNECQLAARYAQNTAFWTTVIFTSIEPLWTMWSEKTSEQMPQLLRRIKTCIEITEGGAETILEIPKDFKPGPKFF